MCIATFPVSLPSPAQNLSNEDADWLTQGFARSASFDSLATKFLAAAADAKSAVVDEVTSAGGSLVDDAKTNAELYGRYMKKAVEKVGNACAGCLPSALACTDSNGMRRDTTQLMDALDDV